MSPLRAFLLGLLVAMAAALAPAGPAVAQSGGASWSVAGAGWGHGVGMSQYGARGLAERGYSHERILGHYYRGTSLSSARVRRLRVLLRAGSATYAFRNATRACNRRLNPRTTYRATRSRTGRVTLRSRSGRYLRNCGRLLRATGRYTVIASGVGRYRGALDIRPGSRGLNLINNVGLEGYLMGVIPREMPTSWHSEALRVQAIAARTYSLATTKGGAGFDHYADTRSQVYGGVAAEVEEARQAVRATRGQILTIDGRPVTTFYHSTSGGHTENNENVFIGGTPERHLRGVRDPYADSSPYHRWGPVRVSTGEMERRLGGLVRGRLRGIYVRERGVSRRIVHAAVVGTQGNRATTGPTLRARLDLRDTLASIRRVSASQAAVRASASNRVVIGGTIRPRASSAVLQRWEEGRWTSLTEVPVTRSGRWSADVPRGTYRALVGGWAASPPVAAR